MTDELLLPEDVYAETVVIGGCFAAPDAETFGRVRDLLSLESFATRSHQVIFDAMSRMYDSGGRLTVATVFQELKRAGLYEAAGSVTRWIAAPQVVNLEAYCEVLAEKERLRRLLAASEDIQRRVAAGECSVEIAAATDATLTRTQAGSKPKRGTAPAEIVERAGGADAFLSGGAGNDAAIPLVWPRLQALTKGLRLGKLWVIGGTPGTGKTSFATQIADAAIELGFRVLFVSREMTADELLHNMACTRAGIDNQRLLAGECSGPERQKVYLALARYTEDLNRLVDIEDEECRTTAAIAAKMRRAQMEGRPYDLLIVDFIQLLKGVGKTESRRTEMDDIAYGLKDIVKTYRTRGIGLAQLNTRKPHDGSQRAPGPNVRPQIYPPTMGDFRESGAIEQAADLAAILRLTDAEQQFKPTSLVDLYVLKQRGGKKAKVPFTFKTWLRRFDEVPLPEHHLEGEAA